MSQYDYHRLYTGLAIYRQKGSKNYYIRMRLKDKLGSGSEFVKSLRTPDKDQATKDAWGHYYAYQNQITPELFTSTRHSLVANLGQELSNSFENKSKKIYSDYKRVLDNEITPTLGKIDIKELDKAAIRDYLTTHAKSTTQVRIRKTALKHLFDLAVEKRLIKEYEIPSFPSIDVEPDEVRAIFSMEQLGQISGWYGEFESSSRKEITLSYRKMLKQYMNFLLYTGIRAGEEALNLRFKDISFEPNKSVFKVKISKGKIHSKSKSSYREVPLESGAVDAISRVTTLFYGANGLSSFQEKLQTAPNENFIFRLPEKQEIKPQYEKMFAQLCKYISLNKQEDNYSLYSYRHTYITYKLKQGVDVYLLATHCGTSVEMIQRYYSKLSSVMRAEELVGDFEGEQNGKYLPF
ncbi:tyrosine-type recombinase/integrase [Vibrio splendidus]|uniref:tyrosine-type recombinase/integrase n=1 Tax=Vibrio splendidus TaxID=29497 RepID=UPI0034A0B652